MAMEMFLIIMVMEIETKTKEQTMEIIMEWQMIKELKATVIIMEIKIGERKMD